MAKYLWCYFIFTLLSFSSFGDNQIVIGDDFQSQKPIEFNYLISAHPLEEILNDSATQWKSSQGGTLNLGVQPQPIWVKFSVLNQTSNSIKLYLLLNHPLLDSVRFHQYHNGTLTTFAAIGDREPLRNRQIKDDSLVFMFELSAHAEDDFYLKIISQGNIKLPMSLWTPEQLLQHKTKKNLITGLFLGFLLALVFSNGLLFMLTRKSHFLLGSLYIACLWILITVTSGLSYRYFYVDVMWLHEKNIALLFLTAAILLNVVTEKLLQLDAAVKSLIRVMRITFVVSTLILLCIPWFSYATGLQTSLFATFMNLIICSGITLFLLLKKDIYAKWILLSQLSYLIAIIFSILIFNGTDHNILPMSTLFMISFFISSMALSYLLILQFIDRRDLKMQRQQALLAEAKIKDNLQLETIKIQQELEEELESRIQEHTFELQITLQELEEKNRELEEKNTLDSLTGIRNRSYFDKKLTMEFRRSHREQTPLAVIMIDIDFFKKINDTYGHLAGDDAIRFVAHTIQTTLKRPSDEVCRYGGEEFAVILPNTDTEGALLVAEAIRMHIGEAQVHTTAGIIRMTISAGLFSAIADRNNEPNQYTALADKALYQAKHAGRNQVIVYDDAAPRD